MKKSVSIVFGTRPEGIKLAPIISAMRKEEGLVPHICVTRQHDELLGQVLDAFEIQPDIDLKLMRPDQSLSEFTARAFKAVEGYMTEYKPDLVLVQGDTTTVFVVATVAFYHRIPVGHVEAGLRTWDKFSPYPEEINRQFTTRLADLHFAPTEGARQNLLRDNISDESIFVTGNPVVDALFQAIDIIHRTPPHISGLPQELQPQREALLTKSAPPLVLITMHRRENFGGKIENICNAIRKMARLFPDVYFVCPAHLNPQVRGPIMRILGGTTSEISPSPPNIMVTPPLNYLEFVALLNRATILLTDSGGIQEEAPSLKKPVLVLRDKTERPEVVDIGAAKLVGSEQEDIINGVSSLLRDKDHYESMAQAGNPFGDGQASLRIVDIIKDYFFH